MSGGKNNGNQTISQTAATVGGAVPSYLTQGVGQPMPGQLEMIAQQLQQGGYGAPVGAGSSDILQALKNQYTGQQAPAQAAAQSAPAQSAPSGQSGSNPTRVQINGRWIDIAPGEDMYGKLRGMGYPSALLSQMYDAQGAGQAAAAKRHAVYGIK